MASPSVENILSASGTLTRRIPFIQFQNLRLSVYLVDQKLDFCHEVLKVTFFLGIEPFRIQLWLVLDSLTTTPIALKYCPKYNFAF